MVLGNTHLARILHFCSISTAYVTDTCARQIIFTPRRLARKFGWDFSINQEPDISFSLPVFSQLQLIVRRNSALFFFQLLNMLLYFMSNGEDRCWIDIHAPRPNKFFACVSPEKTQHRIQIRNFNLGKI